MDMHTYDSYKDSGIDWLGEIPSHWELKKVKYLFLIGRGRVIAQTELVEEGIYPVYSSQTLNNGILGFINTFDFDKPLITWTTDGANAGTVFLRKGQFNCTNVCGTLESTSNDLKEFIVYTLSYVAQYYKRPDTNGAKIMNNEMAEIILPLPPLHEQEAIARFLDDKCAKIDELVAIKEQQIDKLKELRQVKIHQAVTKGINPNVPLKDSGIEWIGEIPVHWEVKRIKSIATIYNGSTPNSSVSTYWDGEVVWVTPKDFNSEKYLLKSERNITEQGYRSCGTTLVPPGSIVLTTRAPIGKVMIAGTELCTNQGCKSLVLVNEVISEYIYSLLLISTSVLNSLGTGTTFMELSNVALKDFEIPIPPLSEQEEIVAYLDKVTKQIDQTINHYQNQIEKLKEYKQSLINAAVTGKIKVT